MKLFDEKGKGAPPDPGDNFDLDKMTDNENGNRELPNGTERKDNNKGKTIRKGRSDLKNEKGRNNLFARTRSSSRRISSVIDAVKEIESGKEIRENGRQTNPSEKNDEVFIMPGTSARGGIGNTIGPKSRPTGTEHQNQFELLKHVNEDNELPLDTDLVITTPQQGNKRNRSDMDKSPLGTTPNSKRQEVKEDRKTKTNDLKYKIGHAMAEQETIQVAINNVKDSLDKNAETDPTIKMMAQALSDFCKKQMTINSYMQSLTECLAENDDELDQVKETVQGKTSAMEEISRRINTTDLEKVKKKMTEDLEKAEKTIKIVRLETDQTNTREESTQKALSKFRNMVNPKDIKPMQEKTNKLDFFTTQNKSYESNGKNFVDLQAVCKDRTEKVELEQFIKKATGIKTGYCWPGNMYKKVKRVRNEYEKLEIMKDGESIKLKDCYIMIRPNRFNNKLVIRYKKEGDGSFTFLETLDLPLDHSICKDNNIENPCKSKFDSVKFDFFFPLYKKDSAGKTN